MEKKRVGVIGSGMIGKQHVEALRRIPCVEVVSLAEMNEALGRKMAEELAIPTFYTDYKKMIENEIKIFMILSHFFVPFLNKTGKKNL